MKHLIKIERQIDEIKRRTENPVRWLAGGIFYGIGWIIGGILAIVALSWFLSLAGVIPGFGDIATKLYDALQSWQGR